MDFPQRDLTHIIERQALEILTQQLPKEWIVREMTERDYGVDLYVEIIREDKKVTGDLIAIQVKGKEKLKIDADGKFKFYTIKKSTLNYWLNLPVPVFFVVVCIESEQSYWCNVRDANRTDKFIKGASETLYTEIPKEQNLSKNGLILFQFNYLREKRWGAVENAMEQSLMLFNSFGPFILMCKRKSDSQLCSTTIQYILLQHYEYFYLLSRYILGKKPKAISEWYDIKILELQKHPNRKGITFSYKVVKQVIKYFASDYREAVRQVNLLVIKYYPTYYQQRFPYLYVHLKLRPLTFVHSDWFARYYNDEYENDTMNIEKKYFDDFTDYDDYDLIDDLNI
ncbi:protein of unknown function [Chryseobacterium arachidis]|uniref:DUF4365 domain-containing protein n=2 Tax=Chryseobacterium arachidis TaxID=1416778 RepID=A0A1M5IAG8_9FLAO|nr:DUF4365 domain-containing protein [Chryseobacterium arachidis]SHG25237.1 protein of unknown function [Chryseobacterium arachidis]